MNKHMKTNMMSLSVASISIGAVALMFASRINSNDLPIVALVVSYLAVGVLVAVAAIDYRAGSRSYLVR